MQMVSEIMTRNVMSISPHESLQRAAQMMDELNVGSLPVCDGDSLVGMITDRDITVRGTSIGKAPNDARVEEVMSGDVRWCFEDQPVDEVMQQMADTQIRRVPVVSHDEQHKLIGIVALGDLATRMQQDGQRQDAQQVMEKVSSPSEPDRSQQRQAGPADGGKDLAAMAPTKGTAAGPGSTQDIGAAAGTGLGAPIGGGTMAGAGGTGTARGTNAPARNIVDAGGAPNTPAGSVGVSASANTGQDKGRTNDENTGSRTGTAAGLAGSDVAAAGAGGIDGEAGAEGRADLEAEGGEAGEEREPTARIDPSGPNRTARRTSAAAEAIRDTAGNTQNTGNTGAPGGTDATGMSGASGGTAGTAGSGGTGVGGKP
jgi:CBS domain-containing protein